MFIPLMSMFLESNNLHSKVLTKKREYDIVGNIRFSIPHPRHTILFRDLV